MVLQRWDPFVEMRSMEDAINRMWRGLGHRPAEANGGEHWHIPLDVVEEGDDIVVHASLPGVEPDAIEVNVEDGVLTIDAKTAAENETRKGGYLLRERGVQHAGPGRTIGGCGCPTRWTRRRRSRATTGAS